MRFFFYGTLIDPEVRMLVLGPELAAACRILPAWLDGWRAARVRGKSYPAAVPRLGSVVGGVLIDGLPENSLDRLNAYEGPEYAACELDIELREGGRLSAFVYVASPACRVTRTEWRYPDWQRRHRRKFVEALRGQVRRVRRRVTSGADTGMAGPA